MKSLLNMKFFSSLVYAGTSLLLFIHFIHFRFGVNHRKGGYLGGYFLRFSHL